MKKISVALDTIVEAIVSPKASLHWT